MKHMITISLIFAVISISLSKSQAVPPPCSPEELLSSSDYAIEGTVIKVECGTPYDSGECKPSRESSGDFAPELVAECTATVKVTKNIKGGYEAGSEAPVPFLKRMQECKNGDHMIPGSPVKNVIENTDIRYYNSKLCRYWNLEQLTPPPPVPEDSGKAAE